MQQRLLFRGLAPVLAGLVSLSCTESTGVPTDGSDATPPTVSIVLADSLVDINDGLRFTLQGSDNVSLLTIGWEVTGAVTRDTSITFTTTTPTYSQEFVIDQGFTGGSFQIVATAIDGARNQAVPDTATATVFDVVPPTMTIISPTAGQIVTTGSSLPIIVNAADPSGITQLTGSIFTRDAFSQPIDLTTLTATFTTPFPTSLEDTLTLTVPDSLLPGTYEVRVFGVDGATPVRSGFSASVQISVVDGIGPAGSWINPPVDSAVVAGDPVTVRFRATDQTGVDSVVFSGFSHRGVDSLGTGVIVPRFLNKTALAGQRRDTTLVRILDPVLTDSTPEQVTLAATVYDVGGTATTITTTIQIVAGPFARVVSPLNGATHAVGTPLSIDVQGFSFNTIEFVGFTTSGATVATDTVQFATPFVQMPTGNLVLPLAATDPLGPLTITPFAIDALGNSIPGQPITITLTDDQPPVVTILQPLAGSQIGVGDSLRVAVQVQDNRGVTSVFLDGIALRGDPLLGTDITVLRFNQKTVSLNQAVDTVLLRDLQPVADSTAEQGFVRVTARDSSGNQTTVTLAIDITVGPTLTILQPPDSSVVAQGFDLTIEVRAAGKLGNKIKRVGFLAIGPTVTGGDSVEIDALPGFSLATLPDTTIQSFDLTIPGGAPLGFFEIVPIGQDSSGNRGAGRSIFVEVVAPSGALDAQAPLVNDSLGIRSETDDSVTVRASDLGGISKIGYLIRDLSNTVIGGDSVTFGATRTNETAKFEFIATGGVPLGQVVTTFPTQVTVEAFAEDGVANRGVLSFNGTTAVPAPGGRRDTLTLVAGITQPLPAGGQIADAILHPGRGVGGELYLTNTTLDHVEVFDIETRAFVATIPTGSRPWGVALWPEDTTGAFGDTIVVANSGGTNLSILDLVSRAEVRRHALPNFIVQSVETATDDASGLIEFEVTEFDFSDRPEYLGMICRSDVASCFADSIIAVYSTLPTLGQTNPFPNRGTVRWENLTACEAAAGKDCVTPGVDSAQSHFFWEHAQSSANAAADTLQILIDRGDNNLGDTLVFAGAGRMVVMADLAFQDTTFVRNSGDFTHALLGEGARPDLARAIMYNGTRPITVQTDSFILDPTPGATCPPAPCVFAETVTDGGVLPGIRIRDFISNSATRVQSIGINFNGLTNMVRADKIYILDDVLRQTGEVQVGGLNAGMDLNYGHDFDARDRPSGLPPGGSDNRLLFASVETPEIVAHDTFVFGEVARIPIKDPIIGFLRVALLTQGAEAGNQLLVGLTQNGVVTVTLPPISNPNPTPPPR